MKRWIAVLLAMLLIGSLLMQIPSALGFGDFDSDSDFGSSDSDFGGSDYDSGFDWDNDHDWGSYRQRKTVTPKPSPTPSPRPVYTPLPGGVDDTLTLVLDWWENGGDLNGSVSIPSVTDAPVTVTGQPVDRFYIRSQYYPYGDQSITFDSINTYYTAEEWTKQQSRYDNSSSRSSDGPIVLLFILVTVFIFIAIAKKYFRSRAAVPRRSDSAHLKQISQLIDRCPDADTASINLFIDQLFRDMQTGWEAGSIENVRDRFIPDTWHGFNNQLCAKNARGETAHVRNIRLNGITLRGCQNTQWGTAIIAEFDAYSNIWTTDREGRIISGTETRRLCQHFAWTLVWSSTAQKSVISCPNCGHTVDASSFAVCPFCKSELHAKGGGWLLAHIEAVSQRTMHA